MNDDLQAGVTLLGEYRVDAVGQDLLAVAVAMGIAAAAWYGITRRRAASSGPKQE